MIRRLVPLPIIVLIVLSGLGQGYLVWGGELKPITLTPPKIDGSKPLLKILNAKQSTREFSEKPLPVAVLSELLWAANGINRPDSGKRTAPSANNRQPIEIYVAMADGVYLYDAKEMVLKPILAGDLREKTGKQPFVKDVPVNLIYVADFNKMGDADEPSKNMYAAADTGFIAQNVYLYCAAEGMACVVRGSVDRAAVTEALKLRPEQRIVFAQSVGYPKK